MKRHFIDSITRLSIGVQILATCACFVTPEYMFRGRFVLLQEQGVSLAHFLFLFYFTQVGLTYLILKKKVPVYIYNHYSISLHSQTQGLLYLQQNRQPREVFPEQRVITIPLVSTILLPPVSTITCFICAELSFFAQNITFPNYLLSKHSISGTSILLND